MMIPFLRYKNAKKAVTWLSNAFGFEIVQMQEQNGQVEHAELRLEEGIIMIGSATAKTPTAPYMTHPQDQQGLVSMGIYIPLENIRNHYVNAKKNGAEILLPLEAKTYGGEDYTCRDFEGFLWSFGTYRPDQT